MKHSNGRFWLSVLAIFFVGLGWGYSQPIPRAWAAPPRSSHPTDVTPETIEPAAVVQFQGSCSPQLFMENIERTEIGTVTESFVVTWAGGGACVTEFQISLLVTRSDGSQRDDRKTFSGNVSSVFFKLGGKRDDKLTKTAKAVVTATGVLAARGSKEVSLAIGGGVGSSGGQLTATPGPGYLLQGSVINSQGGTPLAGVKLSFDVVGVPRGTSSIETNNQGRWQLGGFPIGKQVKVTPSKRFFVFEPADRVVGEGAGLVSFSGRPNEIGAKPTPTATPAQTFTAGGRAVVDSLSQGTQTPLPGATISFKVLNGKPGQANIPGPVTTGKDGRWSQSGFTVGSFTYQATISKSGVTFTFATANFGSSTGAPVGDAGFIGTVK